MPESRVCHVHDQTGQHNPSQGLSGTIPAELGGLANLRTRVNRPNRQLRRQKGGKSVSVDAEGTARAAASGEATAVPKSGDGPVECLRMLLVARRSATKARTQAANQIHSVLVTAPEPVKHRLKGMKLKARVRVCARWRPGEAQTTTAYAKRALRHLARRHQSLEAVVNELDTHIRRLCAQAKPALLAANGVGPDTASALLVAAGDNPERMSTEASLLPSVAPAPYTYHQDRRGGIVSTGAATAKPTARCGASLPPGYATTLPPKTTQPDASPKERTKKRSSAASSGTSPQRSTDSSPTPNCAKLRTIRQQGGITTTQQGKGEFH